MYASGPSAVILAFCGFSLSCAAGTPLPENIGDSCMPLCADETLVPAAGESQQRRPRVAADVVERAALPYQGIRASDGARLEASELFRELMTADAVCVGEQHGNAHHHYAELEVTRSLLRRAPLAGRELGLGLEMIQQPYQPALDRYVDGTYDEQDLVRQTEYAERWGVPFEYYAPLFQLARSHGMPLIALNAPGELTARVRVDGLDALSETEQRTFGDADPDDDEHRALFERAMRAHPHGAHAPDALYPVQVLWDESMAERAAAWLEERLPLRLLVIVAGAAHCHRSAIPRRIERRLSARVVSLRPLVTPDLPAELDGYDYAFVMSAPE
jgi:uncharacterized iron-regulated protein